MPINLKLYNTLSRKVEDFQPIKPLYVSLYTCGPTVYDYAHIGHARKYISDDLLKRVLTFNEYDVDHVMNITDVGHLVSDADDGDDKLEKGAKERDMTVWEVAKFFENDFWENMDKTNIIRPRTVARATEHIKEQIKLIQKLEENGFTYQTEKSIYFDISKFPKYTELSGQRLEDKEVGVREEVKVDTDKKNPADFALWFFTVGHYQDHVMRWPAPWGEGFPGWHIECSAMSMEYLGNTIDIHTGGIDHIPVHHTNEIAQSEAATGEKFVNYWVHHGWLLVDNEKMSKSKKNFYTLKEIEERGFDPLSLRYLFLTTHYRDNINFTWDSLQSAQNALYNIRETVREWESGGVVDNSAMDRFKEYLNTDLNTSNALAVMWAIIKSELPSADKAATLLEMDKVLGLKLDEYIGKPLEIPENIQKLLEERETARANKDFEKSDRLRKEIEEKGYDIQDNTNGAKVIELKNS